MAIKVAGEMYEILDGQLFEIKRQMRQPNGYPFDPEDLKNYLQAAIEGRFVGAREPKAIKIDCFKPFDPVSSIGEGWSIWKGPIDGNGLQGDEEQDERSLALTELDITKIQFKTMLKDNESFIKGEEVLRRLKDTDYIRLGGNVFYALWQDYQKNNENSALEWLRRTCDINYSDFFGLVLRPPGGRRCVLSLCWGGGGWRWDYLWLGSGWRVSHPSALLASS